MRKPKQARRMTRRNRSVGDLQPPLEPPVRTRFVREITQPCWPAAVADPASEIDATFLRGAYGHFLGASEVAA